MLRLVTILALLFAVPAVAAAPVALPENALLDWSGDGGDEQVFTAGDLTLTLRLTGDESERTGTLTVARPGTAPLEVSGLGSGTGYGEVGVFPFDMNGKRSVIFGVYSGGAHCCMQYVAVTETDGGLVSSEIGTVDGDGIALEDIDGDGVFEMPLWDGRFNYAFDAYAFSFPPSLIMKSKDGASYDASAEPQFRPYFEASLERARASCSGETWDLGSCAGLLGMAARLGTFEAELAPVAAALKAGKRTSGWDTFDVCIDTECTETREYTDFVEAIEVALGAWGYLPAR